MGGVHLHETFGGSVGASLRLKPASCIAGVVSINEQLRWRCNSQLAILSCVWR
jgi:hypothetical protein